jgi:hypothetical protein
MIPILTENDVVTGAQGAAADAGSEILLTDQLIPGNQYYFSVKNNNATAGQVSIVISYLRSSEADIMPYTSYTGVYNNTCQNFKAKFRANSTGYTVKRWADQTEANTAVATGAGTPSWVYAIPAGTGTVASTICQLGRILPANILSGSALTYYVTVDAAYNLADAFGNMNALTAADAVLIPMQCEYYALEGLSDLVNTIKKVRSNLNPKIEIEGLLKTLFDKRNMLAQQVSDQLTAHFGDKVYETIIPRNVRLAEAPSHGMPILMYDRSSKGAVAYLKLAEEIIEKEMRKSDG